MSQLMFWTCKHCRIPMGGIVPFKSWLGGGGQIDSQPPQCKSKLP